MSTTLANATQLRDQFNAYLVDHPFSQAPLGLYGPVDYILQAGGKRVRPILTLLGAQLCGGDLPVTMPVALAVEIFHNFTLLHDDIMDDSPLRRGRPTVHEKWDINTAILSGDLMPHQSL